MAKRLIDPANVCLVLTASIRPNAMPGVSIPDPEKREADYLTALRYYLEQHPAFRRIVFIDNSAWPLTRFEAMAAEFPAVTVELISLDENSFPPHLGKSYGEMLLLEKGMAKSKLVAESKYIAKLTGRARLTNLTALVESIRSHFDFLCDVQDHPFYEWLRLPYQGRKADTRFFMFRLRFFDKYVRGRLDELDERRGEYLEDFFYRIARANYPGERVKQRLPREPNFIGTAGHWGKDYSSPKERAKRLLRRAMRRGLPWLKL